MGQITHVFRRLSSGQEPSSDTFNPREEELAKDEREFPGPTVHEKDAQIESLMKERQESTKYFEQELAKTQEERHQWEVSAQAIHRDYEELRSERDETVRKLVAKQRRIEGEKVTIQKGYNELLCRQQETSFKQIESGRWVPDEESKVSGELERLRREMRTWAKGMAIKDISGLDSLDELDYHALMNDLSSVVVFNENQLPSGFPTTKSPSILLNALLAHAVYSSFFRGPFFFLNAGHGTDLERTVVGEDLDEIYRIGQGCK
jgi:hypothetical protein